MNMNVSGTVAHPFLQRAPIHSSCQPKHIHFERQLHAPQPKGWQWQQHLICKMHGWESRLEEKIPNFPIQKQLDRLQQEIEKKFSPLVQFNQWLNSNAHGTWYKELALYLFKLPIKAVRNIIQQLYLLIRSLVYGIVHPLQALNKVAQFLVLLPYELSQPETWSKMGAGIMGTSMGQAVLGNPFLSLIGLGIGAALCIGGISAGTFKAALTAQKGCRLEATKQQLIKQTYELPEALLTGFCIGLIVGGIKRALQKTPSAHQNSSSTPEKRIYKQHLDNSQQISDINEARLFADKFVQEHGFRNYIDLQMKANGSFEIIWNARNPYNLSDSVIRELGLFVENGLEGGDELVYRIWRLDVQSSLQTLTVEELISTYDWEYQVTRSIDIPLDKIGLAGS